MIVKNEEHILNESLESIAPIANEIHITDTGSTDNTVKIAKKFTNNIHHFTWTDDFAAARNASVKHATGDYILRWDADYVLEQKSIPALRQAKKGNFDDANLVLAKLYIEYGDDGFPIKSIPNTILYTRSDFHWTSPIHNTLTPHDKSMAIKKRYYDRVCIHHKKDLYEKKGRYTQTLRIARSHLDTHPDDLRIRLKYAEALIFDELYDQAIPELQICLKQHDTHDAQEISILTLLILCYLHTNNIDTADQIVDAYKPVHGKDKRFLLSMADVRSLSDAEEALELYNTYLLHPITDTGETYLYDHERYVIHPQFMAGYLHGALGKNKTAINLLTQVRDTTHLTETKKKSIMLINNFT
jgi:tetratricopeptide (TPR) repeat protein